MRDYLTSVEVLALHHALIERYGGARGIRDMGAVEAAVFRPQCGYYADITEEAAALLESLLINHPFVDGNGRTGRLLTLLSLYQSGWDFRRGLVLEEYYNLDRRSYYEALQDGRKDLTSWLVYFVKGFWVEALRLQESITSLLAGTGSLHERKLSIGDLKIIDFVVTLDKITSSDVSDILSISKRTAQSHIARLLKFKILDKVASGPATYYKLAKVR